MNYQVRSPLWYGWLFQSIPAKRTSLGIPWDQAFGFPAIDVATDPFPVSQGFPAQFPDDTCGSVPAVELGIGASFARCQALLAVPPLMLAAKKLGLGIGVVAAGPRVLHGFTQGGSSVVMAVRVHFISTSCLKRSGRAHTEVGRNFDRHHGESRWPGGYSGFRLSPA